MKRVAYYIAFKFFFSKYIHIIKYENIYSIWYILFLKRIFYSNICSEKFNYFSLQNIVLFKYRYK